MCADYWVKLSKIPIEVLCMESFKTTLTELESDGIDEKEWLGILFQICFGLGAGQKHLKYIHNDLHSDNIMGGIIKVLMITASGAEGITLKNCRFVHITEPYWHPVRVEQVIGRAVRICSHKDLPTHLRNVKVLMYLM